MELPKTVAGAVSCFGAAVKSKLSGKAVIGAPEDRLRAPAGVLLGQGRLATQRGPVPPVAPATPTVVPGSPMH